MKRTGKSAYRLLSMVLCICMVLSLLPALPQVAEAATVPTYIASIGISQDGSSGSTGINDCKSELAGHTIIDVDLNDEAGGDYVYMGYKTTTDPAQAITGIVFRVGKNPPNSISYGGSTFYLVGGSTEANTAQLGGYIDLNAKAGGYYIYTYVTRDPNYGAPLTNLTVNRSSSYSGWYAGTDTNGNVMDLNDDASNYYMYLHYQRFSGKASSTFYYLTSGGSRTSSTTSVSVKNHTQSVSTTPSVPSTVTYDGRTFTFRGWREDNTASSSTVSPSYTYMTSKTYRAVYSATVALSYNANGGSGAPSSQTATQYINAGSSSVSKTSHSFTISATKPTHDDSKCVFLGWSTGSSATSASHQPGQTITISSNTTLYAVWRGEHTANRTYVNNGANHTYTWPCCGKSVTEAHSYTDGFCVCGAMIPDAVATVSKNGKVVAAYTILNDAIQAVQDCTAADEAVITILKGIALGDNYQSISSGVFTIDLNGFEISSTNSDYGALYIYGATVTIRDSGEDGKITGKRAGIEVFDGELTVLDGTVSGGSRNNCGVYAAGSSTVTISGGSFSGYYGVYATGSSTVTISGGTISDGSYGVYAKEKSTATISGGTVSGKTAGVYADGSNVTISSGTISGGTYSVHAFDTSTVTISGGTISDGSYGVYAKEKCTVTISGGTISGTIGGMIAHENSTVTITGGSISGGYEGVCAYGSTVTITDGAISGGYEGVYADGSTATISGGSISGGNYDIRNYNSTIALTLGNDGVGARFPGGITVLDTTLNEILGEGAAYWQGNTMIIPADGATEITGGDVVIKSTCPHASKSNYTDLKDGASHTYFCSGCNNTFTEGHSYTNLLCVCGAASSDAVASVSKNGKVVAAYATLDDAIQAIKNCTAADKAVVTILQDIALGNSIQGIYSGVFTIDLNGHEISSTHATWGALYIHGSAPNVTIQGTGENSKITGNYAGIEISYGVNLTIAGGTISGDWYGVFADGSNVTISGGSISSNAYDIACHSSTVALTVDEDGVGATFPGGIAVRVTTLNAILGEGAAYWQGNTMITPANNATEITGGDVVIKAECKHPGDKTYTNNGDDHSYTYSCCNNTVTESHSYTNGLCVCGAMVSDAVASVSKNGIVTGAYTTLNDAIQAVRNCTAADKAVVTILQDIALGDSYQEISSGVFTIDLNSKILSGTNSTNGVLYLNGFDLNVTVTDSGTGGTISGYRGVNATLVSKVTISGGSINGSQYGVSCQDNGTVTITGGTISGEKYGVAAYFSGGVTINGGTISGEQYGVYADNSYVTITDGAISGERYGVYADGSNVDIRGGSISGDTYDIFTSSSGITLTLGENGVGATFPGGITVDGTTLNEILDEGAAYWQGNTMILPANNATEIPGGDVVIKAECKHPGDKTYTNNGDDHSYTCSSCNATVTEGHTYIDGMCVCGAAHPDMVASVSKNGIVTGAYTTLNDAIQAVADCTADDKAVVTILQDIALGDSYQEISSGVFTIELNDHEISSTYSRYGVLYINGAAANVTIQGTGENSKITGNHAGIYMWNNATLTIFGGTISGKNGVDAGYSTVTISGGTFTSGSSVVSAEYSTVTISGGTLSGKNGVYARADSTVNISGGTIHGDEYGVYHYKTTVNISGGVISADSIGVYGEEGIVTITDGTIGGINSGVYSYNSTMIISGGTISGGYEGVDAYESTVTISGGTISGGDDSVYASNSTVTITGGTISGNYGVYVTSDSTVTISGGTISGVNEGVHAYNNSTVTINGGTISSEDDGVRTSRSTLTISGGTISGENNGVNHTTGTATISGGTISGGVNGIAADRSTLTISGGTISDSNIRPSFTGVFILDSTVTISGGSISSDDSDDRDIYARNYSSNSIIALTLGEDGVGATFPGGIFVEGTTLNAILGEGAAYWQGDKQINPADDDTEITGGDVVIKAACKHPGDKTYTNNGDDHTYTCSVCDATVTEGHTFIDGVCVCGVADVNVAVASTTVGGITTYYGTLGSAIQAVKDCTAADKAVVTILKDIALGDNYQTISSGVFTIDLNGHEISSTNDRWGALYLSGTDVNVTVQGAGESSKITGSADDGINVFDKATLTITGGTITGKKQGVYAVGSTVTINGGTISGGDRGVYTGYCTVIISDGTISGRFGVSPVETDLIISGGTISGGLLSVYSEYSTVTISGGSFSTGDQHIYSDNSTITLTLGENGVGARFLGGITVRCATLNEILGEGAAYWQGDKQIIPADNATAIFNGDVVIKAYVAPVYSGWTQIDGNWYYFDPDTNTPATGVTRVPYPAQAINGVTYAPNMEDVKYANDKGTLFKDSISAFFVFDENGVFQSDLNGMTSDNRWAVNGCIVWHVGLVQVGEDYYYFIGDVDNGGNKLATGDIYANRNTTDFDMVVGGVYTFGADGKLCKYEGITEVNGVLRYYENAQLMLGKGLTKVGDNYIYVNSDGELIVNSEYYVPGNDLGISSGMYDFDENGFMIEPVSTDKDGIYFENDAWYYYESGEKQYGLGLIGVSKYWYYPDGTRFGTTATIYVRSNGQLATGEYYVTNVDNYDFGGVASGTKMIFSEEGMQYASKNGIYEVEGNLYYFVGNQIQYNAGLIEVDGGWIYVRSNGKLAVGEYWITNTNGNMAQGMYEFGTDGYMVIADIEDGIVNDNGVLYYYLDGKKQYGLGLVKLDENTYIYVRSNGELATGSYWITNHNGLLDEGMYEFDEDGLLTVN